MTIVYGREGFYVDFLFPATFQKLTFPLYSSNREISHSYKEIRCIFSYPSYFIYFMQYRRCICEFDELLIFSEEFGVLLEDFNLPITKTVWILLVLKVTSIFKMFGKLNLHSFGEHMNN